MPTIREKLNIPESLRAMAQPKDDIETRRSLILEYVKEHSGEIIRQSDVADYFGYSTFTVGEAMRFLLEEGRITNRTESAPGAGVKFRFFYHEQPVPREMRTPSVKRVYKKRGDGEVKKWVDRSIVPEAPQLVVEPEPVQETPVAPQAVTSPQNTSDQAFVARMDMEIWEYIRQHGEESIVPKATPYALAGFANHMHTKYSQEG